MTDFPPQLPHGTLTEVLPDIFFVMGQSRPNFGGQDLQFSRNMVVVRDGSDLSLVNTLRLDDAGLADLDRLGAVKNVVRIGAFHGRDDAFYIDRYSATFWAPDGQNHERGETVDRPLKADQPSPVADCDVFAFDTAKMPEAILHLKRHGGILISCDSLQNWAEVDEYFDESTAKSMAELGFLKPANIGPGWKRGTEVQAGDFARLAALEFRHLLSAHGKPLLKDAKAQVCATIKDQFDVP